MIGLGTAFNVGLNPIWDNSFLLLNIASVVVGITIFLSHLVTNNKSRQDKYFGVLMLLCIVACLLDIHWMYIECFGFSDSTRWISTIILNMSMFPVTIGSYIVVRYFECLAVKQTRLVNLTIRILQINLLVVLALTLALTLSGQVLDCSGDTLGYLQGYSMITLVNNVAAVLQVLSTVIILSGVEHKNYLPLILFLLITMGAAACSITGYEYCVFPIITYAGVVFYICIQISKINMSTVESVRDALASAEEKNKLLEESYERLESEQRVLDTIAGIYNTMHVINLKNYDTCELSANSRIHNILTANEDRAMQERMWETMMKVVSEQHRERLFDFTNFSTIENRMEGKKIISCDALSDTGIWWRFIFIRMGKIEEPLEKVIFLSQHIDEDKRKEEELLQASNTDRLTGLYNRHAYYSMIAELERKGLSSSLWYISMNINGIKRINESMGHQAGDELITGAAACMKETFGNNHQIFRMGGDEFVTLIEASESQLDELIDKLNKKIGSWKGTLTSNLSISTGIVCAVEFENCTISMMERESDRRMYDQKRAYYSENQLKDRRNREKRL